MKPSTNFLIFCIISIILLAFAIPLALGVVEPNGIYGFRTESTLRNEELWYLTNKVLGLAMIFSCLAFFVLCFLTGIYRKDTNHGNLILPLFVAQAVVPILIAMIYP